MGDYAFGFDIGGTNVQCGLVRADGKSIWLNSVPTNSHMGHEHVMGLIGEQVRIGLQQSRISKEEIRGIGIGMPGAIDIAEGICIEAGNLPFRHYPVRDHVVNLTGMPVIVDNDVKMYVYGEAMTGAGQSFENVLGLTLGTGVAAAWVNNGEIYRGGGISGEIGHIKFDGIPYRCTCGGTGCLETFVSATGIAEQAKQAVKAGEGGWLAELYDNPDRITAKDVSEAYDREDSLAVAILNRTGNYLGIALSYLVQILDPDIIIVGGGAAKAGERLLTPARLAMMERIQPIYRDDLQIVTPARNDEAGVIGSASWALRKFGAGKG